MATCPALRSVTKDGCDAVDGIPGPGSPVEPVVSDDETPQVETVRVRLQRFLSDERIATHFENKVIMLAGEVVEDLDSEAAPNLHLVIAGS
ncbi:hypothetical protein SAMN05216377_11525 [Pseudonocardia oroxyli]|uniref:Uncharacterized protein n=1 Tax=Pseudonocardia oroxyli TaxID=366584 RepID=A0A1G7WYM6_PSEOR|nr:hypothetical protein SAMN05216377_11525 [Pseudonocardia oroxyli]